MPPIVTRQISDGAVTKEKIVPGAGIESSKLADGANFLKKDGSVAMIGNFDAGNNKVVNVATPTAANDVSNKSYVDTAISNAIQGLNPKGTARAATTTSITISGPGTSVFDGVTLTTGQTLLVRAQAAPAENGLYIFNGSGSALTRSTLMDTWTEVPGALVVVEEGTTYGDTVFLCTANRGGTLETTAITWQALPTSTGLTGANFVDSEVPAGAMNGTNTAFTLAFTPIAGSVHVYYNGIRQRVGTGNDYTISGNTITMLFAPSSTDYLEVEYRK